MINLCSFCVFFKKHNRLKHARRQLKAHTTKLVVKFKRTWLHIGYLDDHEGLSFPVQVAPHLWVAGISRKCRRPGGGGIWIWKWWVCAYQRTKTGGIRCRINLGSLGVGFFWLLCVCGGVCVCVKTSQKGHSVYFWSNLSENSLFQLKTDKIFAMHAKSMKNLKFYLRGPIKRVMVGLR